MKTPSLHIKTLVAVAACLMLESCGPLRKSSDFWAPVVGTDMFAAFSPGFIPRSQFYYSYATATRPGKLFVSPSLPDDIGGTSRAPAGHSLGRYVFAIDSDAGTIDHLTWGEFVSLDLKGSHAHWKAIGDFSSIHPRGTTSQRHHVYPFGDEAGGWLAVMSFDDSTTYRREVGIPSIIPFMGRQKVVEKTEYHSGTAYLEVFALRGPSVPIFRMAKVYKNWRYLPELNEYGGWVIGSERPVLVVVDVGDRVTPGQIVVVRLLTN